MRWGKLELENNLVMAPMAGWTDLPFRLIVKSHGAGLVYTEMISAMGLVRREPKTWALLRSRPRERPLAVQIFGSEPEVLARAARMVQEAGFEAVDLNLGCPARKVVKNGAGSILMRKPDLVRKIFSRVRAATSLTLTVKFRSGWSREEGFVAPDFARLARDEGFDGLAFHPRYGRQGFGGQADWEELREVVEAVDLPVLGSGDVTDPDSAQKMLDTTGCAGGMIGRAALGNPWIFRWILEAREGDQALAGAPALTGAPVRTVEPAQIKEAVDSHLDLLVDHYGDAATSRIFKGWAGRYLKGLPLAKGCREAVNQSRSLEETRAVLDDYFQRISDSDRESGSVKDLNRCG